MYRASRIETSTSFTLIRYSAGGIDGFSVDIEGNQAPVGNEIVELLRELKAAGRKNGHPSFELSFFLPYHPGSIDYPWWSAANNLTGLSQVVDSMTPMMYDLSYSSGNKIASANAPLPKLMIAAQAYVNAGVPPAKLVVALTWFGQDFPCTSNTAGAECTCVQTGGACGLKQLTYYGATVLADGDATLTPVTYHEPSASAWFDYSDEAGARHQLWYAPLLSSPPLLASSRCLFSPQVRHACQPRRQVLRASGLRIPRADHLGKLVRQRPQPRAAGWPWPRGRDVGRAGRVRDAACRAVKLAPSPRPRIAGIQYK